MPSPSSKLTEPSILLAGSNCQKLIRNLGHVLSEAELQKLRTEVHRNVADLFRLGAEHRSFAQGVNYRFWRQKISRLYYAALNMKRAVTLLHSGSFSTDVSDHKNIGALPDDFPTTHTYASQLVNLRDDRNLADYSHQASEADLVITVVDVEALLSDFHTDAKAYLKQRGVNL